jgi:hypothetical protein
MATLVQPRAQSLILINAVTALAAYVGAKLNLFSNNITPTPANVLADFTACIFSGYAPKTVTWSPGFFDANGVAVSSSGELLFQQSGATGDFCYGAYLTDSAGAVLLASGVLDVAPFTFVNNGDTLPLLVKLDVDAGLLSISPVP